MRFLQPFVGASSLICLRFLVAIASGHAETLLKAEILDDSVTVFSHETDACEPGDIPDAPARALRAEDGTVRVLASNSVNRALAGADLLHLKFDCHVVFRGAESDDPARFDDRGWIVSTYTPDGRTVFGLIHNEFRANLRPWLCPSRVYMECWYNAITAAASHDSGRNFTHLGKPPSLIAALPLRFEQTRGQHAGFFNPTNIVEWHGAYYFLANTTGPGPQPGGNCLFRTENLEDSSSWRAWDGAGFTGTVIDPYAETVDPPPITCQPVDRAHLRWPVGSLAFHAGSRLWLMLMMGPSGVVISTSTDLLSWSEPVLVLPGQLPSRFVCGGGDVLGYPALLDPESPDRNFMTVSDSAQLFLTRFNLHDCKITMDRDLIRIPIRIGTGGRAGN